MENIFLRQMSIWMVYIFVITIKALYAVIIYSKCKCENKKIRNALTYLSIPFPIITGIICITKNKKNVKDILVILLTLIFSVVSVIAVTYLYTYSKEYHDKDGTGHIYASDIVFTDINGNKYTYSIEKTGYDYLYINSTDDCLNSDLCYLDSEGYIYYDEDISITAKDESCCVDENGTLYYPVKYTTFDKNGTIKYFYNSGNFSYDRLGNAYTYDNVPYFDNGGNKYFYSFDSNTQKGLYTKISTGETFENEYSFVDENGYYVYDKKHSFIEQKEVRNVKKYTDLSGKIYYRASSVSWNKNGQLLDLLGEIVDSSDASNK